MRIDRSVVEESEIRKGSSLVLREVPDRQLVHSHKRASYSKSAAGLLPCSYQADITTRSHRLLRLDDNKSVASRQQA